MCKVITGAKFYAANRHGINHRPINGQSNYSIYRSVALTY